MADSTPEITPEQEAQIQQTIGQKPINPLLREKLEARQAAHRGDIAPNAPIFYTDLNFKPYGHTRLGDEYGYMAVNDSSTVTSGVTPVVRMYTIVKTSKKITQQEYDAQVAIIEHDMGKGMPEKDSADYHKMIDLGLSRAFKDDIKYELYQIGDHMEPTGLGILDPIDVGNKNIEKANLSNAKGYDPNINTFFKPGVGITKVRIKGIMDSSNIGNQLELTIDLKVDNIHDHYDFIEPNFLQLMGPFNIDIAWSNARLYQIEPFILRNMGLEQIRTHLYNYDDMFIGGSANVRHSYIVQNRGDVITLTARLQNFKANTTKEGGMTVTLTALANDAMNKLDVPVREKEKHSIEDNIDVMIWDTIQRNITSDYKSKWDNPDNKKMQQEFMPFDPTTLRDEYGQLTTTVAFRRLTHKEMFVEEFDEEGNLVPGTLPKYDFIFDPQTGDKIYFDPETGENFIHILITEVTLEEVFDNLLIKAKEEGGHDWVNFVRINFPAAIELLPSHDGQQQSAEFWEKHGARWFFNNITKRFIPQYYLKDQHARTITIVVDEFAGDEPIPPYTWPTPPEYSPAINHKEIWMAAKEEFLQIQKHNVDAGPTETQRAEYAVAPPPPGPDASLLSRRVHGMAPVIVNATDAQKADPSSRLNLLADFLKQQSLFFADSITKPNVVSSEWGVWIRKLDDDMGVDVEDLDVNVADLNLTTDAFYVSLGWFEDNILNEYYGNIQWKADKSHVGSRAFDSRNSEIRRFSAYENWSIDQAQYGKSPYIMYPGRYQQSYNAKNDGVPTPYRADHTEKTLDPETGIAANYEWHTKKRGVVPIRELFINVGKMMKSFKDAQFSLYDALKKMMQDISSDTLGFYQLQFMPANSYGSSMKFIEVNHQHIVDIPRSDADDPVFYFRPFSPESIVYDCRLGVTQDKDIQNAQYARKLASDYGYLDSEKLPAELSKLVSDLDQQDQMFKDPLVRTQRRFYEHDAESDVAIKEKYLEKMKAKKAQSESALASKLGLKHRALKQLFGMGGFSLAKPLPNIWKLKVDYGTDDIDEKDSIEDTINNKPPGKEKVVDLPKEPPKTVTQILTRELQKQDKRTPKYLPYTLDLSIFGTGLFDYLDMISVDILPRRIRERYYFAIMGIDHSIDSKGWKTDLRANLLMRADTPPAPKEVNVIEPTVVDVDPTVIAEDVDPPDTSKDTEKPEQKMKLPIDFGETGEPVPALNGINGVINATKGVYQGPGAQVWFTDLLRGRDGGKLSEDINWHLFGIVCYKDHPAGTRLMGSLLRSQMEPDYYPSHVSKMFDHTSGWVLTNVTQKWHSKIIAPYFEKNPNDPLAQWWKDNIFYQSNQFDYVLNIEKGKRYIVIEHEHGTLILKQDDSAEPFYDFTEAHPDPPPEWDQELFGPWKDDQLKRIYENSGDLKQLHTTWYDGSKTSKPEPGTPSEEITGYQVIVYQMTAQDRHTRWVSTVPEGMIKTGPSKMVVDHLDQMKWWHKAWFGTNSYKMTQLNTLRDIKLREAAQQTE